jgi:hypothetical protein
MRQRPSGSGSAPRLPELHVDVTASSREWIGKGEHHRDAHADQEVRIDQAGQQEHLYLQRVHQFRLAGRALKILAAHDSDADAGAGGAESDDEPAGEGDESDVGHCDLQVRMSFRRRRATVIRCAR